MSNHIFVSAEIGINHNGDLEIAKRLIDAAVLAGCDSVKFQKRTIDAVYTREFLDSPRQSPWGSTQRAQKEGLEFGEREYTRSTATARSAAGLVRLRVGRRRQKFLRKYDLKYNKVASPVLTNEPLLKTVAEEKRYTFIATGMSTWEEIDFAVELFRKYDCPFELMHCVSIYPMQPEEANLLLIPELRKRYDCPVGYSSHEMGNIASMGAVALGAVSSNGYHDGTGRCTAPTRTPPFEPAELLHYVKEMRTMARALGSGVRQLSERRWRSARRCAVELMINLSDYVMSFLEGKASAASSCCRRRRDASRRFARPRQGTGIFLFHARAGLGHSRRSLRPVRELPRRGVGHLRPRRHQRDDRRGGGLDRLHPRLLHLRPAKRPDLMRGTGVRQMGSQEVDIVAMVSPVDEIRGYSSGARGDSLPSREGLAFGH
jgi:N-acetylneuraminate synthase